MKLIPLLILLSSFSVQANDAFCPVPDLSAVLPQVDLPQIPGEDLIEIKKIEYKRNKDASFCVRSTDMIDTIVLHHSETPETATPEYINQLHLNRASYKTVKVLKKVRGVKKWINVKIADPWYMIGYSYVINSPYQGQSTPAPVVTEGRPIEIVGSHAGSAAFSPMDEVQTARWNEGTVKCGKEGQEFQMNPNLMSGGKIKSNVTTIGIVVVGNYAPYSTSPSSPNPNGYSRANPRYPTVQTQDMIARLSCQLQQKYPRMKNIKWHNYYHSTSCPGTIKNYIGQIKTMAKGYGCDFN